MSRQGGFHTACVVEPPEHWAEVDGALEREFRFADFGEALAFVNRVGRLAERRITTRTSRSTGIA